MMEIEKKTLITLFICLLFGTAMARSATFDSLQECRIDALKTYQHITDTMTRRTWMNMYYYSGSLVNIVKIDNIILDSIIPEMHNRLSIANDSITQLNDELIMQQEKVIKNERELAEIQYHYDFLVLLIGVITIFLLLFLLLFIIYISKSRKLSKKLVAINEEALMDKISSLEEQIDKALDEKKAMEGELTNARSEVEKESAARDALQTEIRKLIEQLRNLGKLR